MRRVLTAFDDHKLAPPVAARPGCTPWLYTQKISGSTNIPPHGIPVSIRSTEGNLFLSKFISLAKGFLFSFLPWQTLFTSWKRCGQMPMFWHWLSAKEGGVRLIYGTADQGTKEHVEPAKPRKMTVFTAPSRLNYSLIWIITRSNYVNSDNPVNSIFPVIFHFRETSWQPESRAIANWTIELTIKVSLLCYDAGLCRVFVLN